MAKVVCENCKIEVEVPEGYNAPFLRCPDCGAIQKYNIINENEPKFKILDKEGRERAANKVVGKEYVEQPISEKKPIFVLKKEVGNDTTQEEETDSSSSQSSSSILDQKALLLDSIGEEGLKKAYTLVSSYINSSSQSRRKNARAKAIQSLMRDKYPLELASKAISYAEKSPEVQALAKSNNLKSLIIIAVVIIAIIIISLVFLI